MKINSFIIAEGFNCTNAIDAFSLIGKLKSQPTQTPSTGYLNMVNWWLGISACYSENILHGKSLTGLERSYLKITAFVHGIYFFFDADYIR